MIRCLTWMLAVCACMTAAETQNYYFGFLKSAPNRAVLPKEEAARIQAAHLAHLGAMNERGGLVCAGPLAGGGEGRGVIIYQTATLEEARANAEADPAVKAGQLVVELFAWTGPAGIGEEYRRRAREAAGAPAVKMVKYHLRLAASGAGASGAAAARAVAGGPYRNGETTGELEIFAGLPAEERKALEGGEVRVLLDWYVAEGVLPAKR